MSAIALADETLGRARGDRQRSQACPWVPFERPRKNSSVMFPGTSYSGLVMEHLTATQLNAEQTRTVRIVTLAGQHVVLNVTGDSEDMRHLSVVLEDCVAAREIKSASFDWSFDPQVTRTMAAREYDRRICEWRGR